MANNETVQRLLVPIQDVQEILGGVSRGLVLNLLDRDELVSAHVGARLLITRKSLDAYLDRIMGS